MQDSFHPTWPRGLLLGALVITGWPCVVFTNPPKPSLASWRTLPPIPVRPGMLSLQAAMQQHTHFGVMLLVSKNKPLQLLTVGLQENYQFLWTTGSLSEKTSLIEFPTLFSFMSTKCNEAPKGLSRRALSGGRNHTSFCSDWSWYKNW